MSKQPRAVAAALIQKDGKYLLTREVMANGKERWIIPGGGIDFGESITEAIVREIKEELGLDIKVGEYIGHFESIFPEVNYHSIIFFHHAEQVSDNIELEDCVLEVKYFEPDEIKDLDLVISAEAIFKRLGVIE